MFINFLLWIHCLRFDSSLRKKSQFWHLRTLDMFRVRKVHLGSSEPIPTLICSPLWCDRQHIFPEINTLFESELSIVYRAVFNSLDVFNLLNSTEYGSLFTSFSFISWKDSYQYGEFTVCLGSNIAS
jgi:hypothetical protein